MRSRIFTHGVKDISIIHPNIVLEGISTHFASSEILDAPENQQQIANFESAIRIVQEAGFRPALLHMDVTRM